MSPTQVWRVVKVYGKEVGKPTDEVVLTPCKRDEVIYAMEINEKIKLLLDGQVEKIIKGLVKMPKKSGDAEKLIDYYKANKTRMNYPLHKKMGTGIIGSGAIESAHRTVVQKRLKQSGQRWSKMGVQNILNLRVTKKNNQWSKIVSLSRKVLVRPAA